ncbi:copper resistance protein CopC [Paraburkholderia sacchari]|uniref:copper resistance protein CopC n=1 Tax=Paraburkholderia sacchari TaxID=159450 RepID=UPI000541EA93|nr:copper resistance protein CopC [Paraburkholderia sacchari]NLP65452.1 copper resistance protein CopC [Paraburkholderia sacchari]
MLKLGTHPGSLRLAAGALALAGAQLAWAHAHPTHQRPPAGSTVTTAQNTVVIDFDDALEPAFSSIDVTDAAGKSVIHGKAAVDPANGKRMSVALDALAAGKYTVKWVAVAADGHRTTGHYSFTVK